MNDCIFCNIIAGNIPSVKIYEDEDVFAFLDINPNSIGHTLVVPKQHVENIHDVSDEALAATMIQVKKVATVIKKALAADGVNISINNGKAAGQVVFHLHIHIIPRFENDHEKLGRHVKYKEGEMDEVSKKIKHAF